MPGSRARSGERGFGIFAGAGAEADIGAEVGAALPVKGFKGTGAGETGMALENAGDAAACCGGTGRCADAGVCTGIPLGDGARSGVGPLFESGVGTPGNTGLSVSRVKLGFPAGQYDLMCPYYRRFSIQYCNGIYSQCLAFLWQRTISALALVRMNITIRRRCTML